MNIQTTTVDWEKLEELYPKGHLGIFRAGDWLHEVTRRVVDFDTDRCVFSNFGMNNSEEGYKWLGRVKAWNHGLLDLSHINVLAMNEFAGLDGWLRQYTHDIHFIFPGRLLLPKGQEVIRYTVLEETEEFDDKGRKIKKPVEKSRMMDVVHVPVLTPIRREGKPTVWNCAAYPVHRDTDGEANPFMGGVQHRGFMGGLNCVVVGYDG